MATAEKTQDILGTGRRKTSVARVRIRPGAGQIQINGRTLEEFFPTFAQRNAVLGPLETTGKRNEVDVIVQCAGGGTTGQSGAARMGIARALVAYVDHDEEIYHKLREAGHLTRDSRMTERKKPGLHGARRGTQFSKR